MPRKNNNKPEVIQAQGEQAPAPAATTKPLTGEGKRIGSYTVDMGDDLEAEEQAFLCHLCGLKWIDQYLQQNVDGDHVVRVDFAEHEFNACQECDAVGPRAD